MNWLSSQRCWKQQILVNSNNKNLKTNQFTKSPNISYPETHIYNYSTWNVLFEDEFLFFLGVGRPFGAIRYPPYGLQEGRLRVHGLQRLLVLGEASWQRFLVKTIFRKDYMHEYMLTNQVEDNVHGNFSEYWCTCMLYGIYIDQHSGPLTEPITRRNWWESTWPGVLGTIRKRASGDGDGKNVDGVTTPFEKVKLQGENESNCNENPFLVGFWHRHHFTGSKSS